MLRLACRSKVKPVHFVSTLTVFPLIDQSGMKVGHEDDGLDHGAALLGGYSQSKWVAEKLMMAARERGLPVCHLSAGAHHRAQPDGAGEPDDFMWNLIKTCIQTGQAPAVDVSVDMTPVDYVSRAIVHLSRQPQSLGQAFHLVNPRPIGWGELLGWLRSVGYPVQEVSPERWQAQMMPRLGSSPEGALFALLPLLSALKTDGPVTLPSSASTAATRWPAWRAAPSAVRRWMPRCCRPISTTSSRAASWRRRRGRHSPPDLGRPRPQCSKIRAGEPNRRGQAYVPVLMKQDVCRAQAT